MTDTSQLKPRAAPDDASTGFATLKTSRETQALMTYFSPTVVPVFKVRYDLDNRAQVIEHFARQRAEGVPSAKTNLSCWHTDFDLLDAAPELLGQFAWDMMRLCTQCLTPDRPANRASHQIEMWYADYDEGGFAREHSHGFNVLSFCYYVEVAEGASGLVFHENGLDIGHPIERTRSVVPVTSGDLVIFPGFLRHSVPPSPGQRKVIAGNIFDSGGYSGG